MTRVDIEPTIVSKEIEDLMNVCGVGEKSFLSLKDLIMVSPPKTEK